jgi:hypothetical protein
MSHPSTSDKRKIDGNVNPLHKRGTLPAYVFQTRSEFILYKRSVSLRRAD